MPEGKYIMARKKFCELNLTHAFMFAAAMTDSVVFRVTLEVLLGKTVKKVNVNVEHSLLFSSDSRNIRLDVYGDDETDEYNVEMQGEDEGNLPKRSRYHQAEMDVLALKPGEDFNKLKPNTVMFICNFDPFGDGLYQYTYRNICVQNGRELGDETTKIFFNIQGRNPENTPQAVINLLKYMADTTDECEQNLGDANVSLIHKHVTALKRSREWEMKYMRFDELLKKEKDAGHAAGEADMLELITRMHAAGEADKVMLLAEDAEFLEMMREKYLTTKLRMMR